MTGGPGVAGQRAQLPLETERESSAGPTTWMSQLRLAQRLGRLKFREFRPLAYGKQVANTTGMATRHFPAGTATVTKAMASLLVTFCALPACFYVDDLNTRPVVSIEKISIPALARGSVAKFRADRYDEDDGGNYVSVSWEMRVCGRLADDCDFASFFTGTNTIASVLVPPTRSDGSPVEKLEVILRGVDPQGAESRPTARQVYDVGNAAPLVVLQTAGFDNYPVGVPFSIRARITDPDDTATAIAAQWKVYSPAGSANPALEMLAPDPARPNESSYRLLPDKAGKWTIEVTAMDAIGAVAVEHIDVQVAEDRPPCIDTVTPLPAPAASTAILDVAQRFAVQVVDDDLDIFPAPVGDPFVHETKFAWSIKSPLTGGVRSAIDGPSRAAIELDPALYNPGDIIELRVEISDRVARTLSCADGAPTCSINSNACVQRQTWRLEVR